MSINSKFENKNIYKMVSTRTTFPLSRRFYYSKKHEILLYTHCCIYCSVPIEQTVILCYAHFRFVVLLSQSQSRCRRLLDDSFGLIGWSSSWNARTGGDNGRNVYNNRAHFKCARAQCARDCTIDRMLLRIWWSTYCTSVEI